MYDDQSKGISYTAGFFMLIAFAVAGAIFAQVLYSPVWTAMTGKSLKALSDGTVEPQDTNAVRVVQCISAIVGFLLPAIATATMMHRRPMQLLGFTPRLKPGQAGIVIVVMFVALIVSSAFSYLNHQFPIPASWKSFFDELENNYNRMVEAIIRLNTVYDFIIALIVMAFIPALCEETLFRGGLQNFLARAIRSPWVAIIIVSLLFSLVHLSYYGFLSRLFLGVVLGLIYQYSGNLWLSILAHFFNNALALTLLFIYKNMGKSISEAISETRGSWWGILLLPVLIVVIIQFRKMLTPKRGYINQ